MGKTPKSPLSVLALLPLRVLPLSLATAACMSWPRWAAALISRSHQSGLPVSCNQQAIDQSGRVVLRWVMFFLRRRQYPAYDRLQKVIYTPMTYAKFCGRVSYHVHYHALLASQPIQNLSRLASSNIK